MMISERDLDILYRNSKDFRRYLKSKCKVLSLMVLYLFIMLPNVFADCSGLRNASLVAYYSFDADCFTDDGDNGYDGVNDGASNVGGKIGNACDFELTETDWVNLSSIWATFNAGDDFTICMWLQLESWTGDMIMLGLSDMNVNSFGLMYFDQSDGNFESYHTINAVGTNTYGYGNYNNDENWHYFCQVISAAGGVVNVYVDGDDRGSDTSPALDLSPYDHAMIGAWYQSGSGYGGYFDGRIDEVAIWQATLDNPSLDLMYAGADGCSLMSQDPSLLINTNLSAVSGYTQPKYFIEYNGTIENAENIFNCSLRNSATVLINEPSANLTVNNEFILNLSGEGSYSLNIFCENLNTSNVTGSFAFEYNLTQEESIATLTDEYLLEIIEINTDILEVLNMTGFIILWLGLWVFGYYVLQTGNTALGMIMIALTIPIDIYFSYALREVLMLGTGAMGLAFTLMALLTIGGYFYIKKPVSR